MWTKTQFVDLNYFVNNHKILKFSELLKIVPMSWLIITNYNQNKAFNVKKKQNKPKQYFKQFSIFLATTVGQNRAAGEFADWQFHSTTKSHSSTYKCTVEVTNDPLEN